MNQNHHVLQLQCDPIPVVRMAFIGLGSRGYATLERYMIQKNIEIKAICDLVPDHLEKGQALLAAHGWKGVSSYSEADEWKEVCRRPDIDLVYICTDWETHAAMVVEALEQGKHVAVEVPLAMSVADCWKIVDTAEKMRRHCFLLENCCYDPFTLTTFQMAREGCLGEVQYCEGAYIHDLRERYLASDRQGGYYNEWMSRFCRHFHGNPYPTHGLGPIAQLLHIHRGDRMKYLVSMPAADPGDPEGCPISTTLIRTARGKAILLHFDISTPRPYSRMQTTCGQKGFTQKYPEPCILLEGAPEHKGEQLEALMQQHTHFLTATYGAEGRRLGVPNEMNYVMDRRLIHCLRHGLPLDIDVYDAAEWSCITELSHRSACQGSIPVEIPDFTRGHWQDIPGFTFHP